MRKGKKASGSNILCAVKTYMNRLYIVIECTDIVANTDHYH